MSAMTHALDLENAIARELYGWELQYSMVTRRTAREMAEAIARLVEKDRRPTQEALEAVAKVAEHSNLPAGLKTPWERSAYRQAQANIRSALGGFMSSDRFAPADAMASHTGKGK